MSEYKSGTRWCFWRWSIVPSDYIRRLHIVKTPWFAICLHWINHPDPEPHLHDHPVTFLSIILRGWYVERFKDLRLDDRFRVEWRRRTNFIRGDRDYRHKITRVSNGGCLTLCLMGPKRQEWGFHTPDGWVHWKAYNQKQYSGVVSSSPVTS